jgi:NAD(P)-dependent dehydrogenase (short-subunit alcohol dehydrogenase family)
MRVSFSMPWSHADSGSSGFQTRERSSQSEEHFDKIIGLNVRGTLFTVQKALPLFNDGGSIILNGSIASIKGFPAFGVYSASKAAVRSFARTWTMDLKARNIRVNVLSPGTIDTPIMEPLGKEAIDQFVSLIPRGTMGRPEEIAIPSRLP